MHMYECMYVYISAALTRCHILTHTHYSLAPPHCAQVHTGGLWRAAGAGAAGGHAGPCGRPGPGQGQGQRQGLGCDSARRAVLAQDEDERGMVRARGFYLFVLVVEVTNFANLFHLGSIPLKLE